MSNELSKKPIRHAVSDELINSKKAEISSIRDALRPELSWTHYRHLLKVENENARKYYMNECAEENCSTRTLERQINSLYFERLLSSKNKKALITKTKKENSANSAEITHYRNEVMAFMCWFSNA